MIKILHLIAPVSIGGGETLLLNLLSHQEIPFNEEIALIYSSHKFEDSLSKAGVKTFVLRSKSLGHGISKAKMGLDILSDLLLLPQIISIIKTEGIEILHAHGFPASVLGYLVKNTLRIRTVYTHHSYKKPPTILERLVFDKVLASYDIRTSVSQFAANALEDAFPKAGEFHCVYNCIDDHFFESKRLARGRFFPCHVNVFIQIGRFVEGKNQAFVCEAFAELSKKIQDKIGIIFVGDGPELHKVKDLVRKLKIEEFIYFCGAKTHNEIYDILCSCDYGLFPSDAEGFGIGAVECMAAGLPVLALDNALMREIIGNTGVLVKKPDLAIGMVQMMESSEELHKVAKKRAESFRVEHIKKQYITIYKKCMEL